MTDHTPSDLPSRMTEKIKVDPSSGCWSWTGYIQSNGYGKVGLDGRTLLAHRVTYTFLVGEIPSGLVIDHICRNRCCVNPTHLRVVTHWENIREPRSLSISNINAAKTHCPQGHPLVLTKSSGARSCRECVIARDRARWPAKSEARRLRRFAVTGGHGPRGERHPNAKITDADVALLRQLHSEGMRGIDLAVMFGIGKAQVSRIVNGKRRTEAA